MMTATKWSVLWVAGVLLFVVHGWMPSVAMAQAKPDLIVDSVSGIPTSAKPGDLLNNIKVCAKNNSQVVLRSAFTLALYLSQNNTISIADQRLNERSLFNGLAAGATDCVTFSFQLPTNTPAGSFWMGAVVDYDSKVDETDENNNASQAYAIKIPGPDLVIDSFTGMTSPAKSSDPVKLRTCIKNIGTTDATASFVLRLVYSADATVSTSDPNIWESTFTTGLAVGKVECRDATGVLPANLQAGTRYVGAYVDISNKISEENESNNTKTQSFLVEGPDLVVSSVSGVPASGKPNDTFTVKVCVKNQGKTDAQGSFKIGIYDSTNNVISTGDTRIATDTVTGGISKGVEICRNISVTLPTSFAAGAHWLGAVVDYDSLLAEENETNNASSAHPISNLQGIAELTVDSIKGVPSTSVGGATFAVEVCVKNSGTLDATSVKLRVLYSTNNVISLSDVGLADKTVTILKASTFCEKNISITLPSSLSVGDHWIGAFIDYDNQIKEADDNNNTLAQKFRVELPDLIVDSITGVPATAKPNDPLLVKVCIKNQGLGAAGPFRITLRYSNNSTISLSDEMLGNDESFTGLGPGLSDCKNMSTTFPSRMVPSSDGWIGVIADFESKVYETNESNNIKFVQFKVSAFDQPDLIISSFTGGTTSSVKIGDELTYKICVKNQGKADAAAFRVGIYYSSDAVINNRDVFLQEIDFASGLKATVETCQNIKVKVPPSVNPGNSNYIGAYADDKDVIYESSESNNSASSRITVGQFLLPDLTFTSFTVPARVPLTGSFTASFCVTNAGQGDLTAPYKVAVYHSVNDVIDTTDTKLGEVTVSTGLAVGKSDCQQVSVRLPTGVTTNGWFGAFVDFESRISESDEGNNTRSVTYLISRPDLVIDTLSGVPSTAKGGDSFQVKVCINNLGGEDTTTSFKLGVFYSAAATISASSTKLGETTYATGLTKNKVECKDFSITLPTTLAVGDNVIGAFVDFEAKVTEENETNNIRTITFKLPGPDLDITSFGISPNTGTSGTSVAVNFCVKNIGATDITTAFRVGIFESENTTISTSDTPLTYVSYANTDLAKFKAGATGDCRSVPVSIPAGRTPGTRYLGVLADVDGAIREEIETNNTEYAPFYIASPTVSNLVLASIILTPTTLQAGDSVTVDVCFLNIGPAISNNVVLSLYYLSSQTVGYGSANKILDVKSYTGLQSNATVCEKTSFKIPATFRGSRWIGAWIDSAAAITEVTEVDNQKSAELTIKVDPDNDQDGVPASVDCDDNNNKIYPAYQGKAAAAEICDGKDNNCDGKIDEGCQCLDGNKQACGKDVGECKKGTQTCVNGKWDVCVGEVGPQKESCDGRDNNCDGTIDETFTNLGNTCEMGQGGCKAQGKYVCKADGTGEECDAKPSQPQVEICNGQDDDCDGTIDNDASLRCPRGQVCVQGACITPPPVEVEEEAGDEEPVSETTDESNPEGEIVTDAGDAEPASDTSGPQEPISDGSASESIAESTTDQQTQESSSPDTTVTDKAEATDQSTTQDVSSSDQTSGSDAGTTQEKQAGSEQSTTDLSSPIQGGCGCDVSASVVPLSFVLLLGIFLLLGVRRARPMSSVDAAE